MNNSKYSLSKDILETLLWQLLDLRYSRRWLPCLCLSIEHASKTTHYTLSDELLLNASQKSQYKRFVDLVEKRLAQLVSHPKPNGEIALEKAQLYGWMAYYRLKFAEEQGFNISQNLATLDPLVDCVKALTESIGYSRWPLFWRPAYRRHLSYLCKAIRLEAGEIKLPQPEIERTVATFETIRQLQRQLIEYLEKNEVHSAKILCKKILLKQPYSLRLQILEAIIEQVDRLELNHKRLQKYPTYQSLAYRMHLFERSDRAVKNLCSLLRIAARHPQMPIWLLEPLGALASAHWNSLFDLYETELLQHKDCDTVYWRLWIQTQILLLGAHLGGVVLKTRCKRKIEDWHNLSANFEAHPVNFLVLVIYLLQQATQSPSTSLDKCIVQQLGRIMQEIGQNPLWAKWGSKLQTSQLDLHLLYHRDHRAGDQEALRLAASLLSIYPSSSDQELLAVGLDLMEHFYDLWSGSAFKTRLHNS